MIMKLKVLIAVIFLFASGTLWALDLDEAKAQGWVGEKASGYLGVPNKQDVSDDVIALIKMVNGKRKVSYERIAKKNGLNVSDVAKLAHDKAVKRTREGNYYQKDGGVWVKK